MRPKPHLCRCGLVRFHKNLQMRCCNENHLKNALENPHALTMNFNDEWNKKKTTTNERYEFGVSWQLTMVFRYFSSSHHEKIIYWREKKVVMRVCRWAVVQLSPISQPHWASVRTIYSALKKQKKNAIIIIIMIMLHLNFFVCVWNV